MTSEGSRPLKRWQPLPVSPETPARAHLPRSGRKPAATRGGHRPASLPHGCGAVGGRAFGRLRSLKGGRARGAAGRTPAVSTERGADGSRARAAVARGRRVLGGPRTQHRVARSRRVLRGPGTQPQTLGTRSLARNPWLPHTSRYLFLPACSFSYADVF